MKREVINHSDILSLGYGVFSSKLEIEFVNGGIFQYLKVPLEVFKKMKEHHCCSEFFHNNIKNSYNYKRVG